MDCINIRYSIEKENGFILNMCTHSVQHNAQLQNPEIQVTYIHDYGRHYITTTATATTITCTNMQTHLFELDFLLTYKTHLQT